MKCVTWILINALSMQFFIAPVSSSPYQAKEFVTLRVEGFENQTSYPIFDKHVKLVLQRVQAVLENSQIVKWDPHNLNSDVVLVGHLEIENTDLVVRMDLIHRRTQSRVCEITKRNRLHQDIKPIADEIGGQLLSAIQKIIIIETPVVAELPIKKEPEKKKLDIVPQDTVQVADLGDKDEIPPQKDEVDEIPIKDVKKEAEEKDKEIDVAEQPKLKEASPKKKKKTPVEELEKETDKKDQDVDFAERPEVPEIKEASAKKKTLLYVGLGALILGGGVLAITMSGQDEGPSALMDPPARPGE